MELTPEQRETVNELRAEIRSLDLQADEQWAKYIATNDEDCLNNVLALESEIEMKGLIAYIPKAGERRIAKIRSLVAKIKGNEGYDFDGCKLGEQEARLTALDAINAWRESLDLPPLERLPKGIPGDSQECTLAKALRQTVNDKGWNTADVEVSGSGLASIAILEGEEGQLIESPFRADAQYASEDVVKAFDNWDYLDLVDDDSLLNGLEAEETGYADLGDVAAEARRRGLIN